MQQNILRQTFDEVVPGVADLPPGAQKVLWKTFILGAGVYYRALHRVMATGDPVQVAMFQDAIQDEIEQEGHVAACELLEST